MACAIDDQNTTEEMEEPVPKLQRKKKKEIETGIIYLSRIPTRMSCLIIRQSFAKHGTVGKIFLQPDDRQSANKKNRVFTEGWVEFADKRVAKKVAATLNNATIGGRRRNPWYDETWNIKYLPKFKWIHLNERLAYEREVHKHRMRTEVAQAKKETAFYIQNVEKRQIQKKLQKKGKELNTVKGEWTFNQRVTDEEKKEKILKKRKAESTSKPSGTVGKKPKPAADRRKASSNSSFLKGLFSGGVGKSSDDS